MNKKLNIALILIFSFAFFLGSCSDNDNDNTEVSEEWKEYQKQRVTDVTLAKDSEGKTIYSTEQTEYQGIAVYSKPSDFITNILEKNEFLKDGPIDGLEVPEKEETAKASLDTRKTYEKVEYDTDIVKVRYHAYYYSMAGDRLIFESHETYALGSSLHGQQLNKPNPDTQFVGIGSLIEGFKTALYNMKVGDEKLVCIPYNAAYGTSGSGSIPGYTTLFFNIKLLEVTRDR